MMLGMNGERSSVLQVCTLLSVLFLAGCYESVPPPQVVGETRPPTGGAISLPAGQYHVVGRSVQGWPITAVVFGQGQDTTFILATIHGDESAGTSLIRQLGQHLEQNPRLLSGRKVVILPIANPDGMVAGTRYNANGVDINRNFQTANRVSSSGSGRAALSEPETQAIDAIIQQYAPDRVVSIHERTGCIDYDGPAYILAGRMAQYCDLPVKRLGARPGSLGSYAGATLGIPTITLELLAGDSKQDQENLWRRYGRALLAAVTYPSTYE